MAEGRRTRFWLERYSVGLEVPERLSLMIIGQMLRDIAR